MIEPITQDMILAVESGSANLLDVRRDDEWSAGHAEKATHWPVENMAAGELPDIPKDVPVYTYCAAGGRAGTAADILRAQGWQNVTNIGGLKDWVAAGGPVTDGR